VFAAAALLPDLADRLSLEDVRRLVLDGAELAADADADGLTMAERIVEVNKRLPVGMRFADPDKPLAEGEPGA
jgi:hypothetical protein